MTIQAEVPPEAVLIRFPPIDSTRLLRKAELSARRTGVYALSVFADRRRGGELESDTIARLLTASELSGIQPERNNKYYVCERAEEIYRQGFTFVKDGYEGELAEHYSVDLGPTPTITDVERFVQAFDQVRRR